MACGWDRAMSQTPNQPALIDERYRHVVAFVCLAVELLAMEFGIAVLELGFESRVGEKSGGYIYERR